MSYSGLNSKIETFSQSVRQQVESLELTPVGFEDLGDVNAETISSDDFLYLDNLSELCALYLADVMPSDFSWLDKIKLLHGVSNIGDSYIVSGMNGEAYLKPLRSNLRRKSVVSMNNVTALSPRELRNILPIYFSYVDRAIESWDSSEGLDTFGAWQFILYKIIQPFEDGNTAGAAGFSDYLVRQLSSKFDLDLVLITPISYENYSRDGFTWRFTPSKVLFVDAQSRFVNGIFCEIQPTKLEQLYYNVGASRVKVNFKKLASILDAEPAKNESELLSQIPLLAEFKRDFKVTNRYEYFRGRIVDGDKFDEFRDLITYNLGL
jgi:hypothetical protein